MNAIATQTAPNMVPTNGQPVTMLEVVEHEARGYRAWGNEIGDFLASQMDRLAQLIAWTDATNPADFVDRLEIWDNQIRQQWEDRGYKAGVEAASGVYGLSLDDRS